MQLVGSDDDHDVDSETRPRLKASNDRREGSLRLLVGSEHERVNCRAGGAGACARARSDGANRTDSGRDTWVA